MKKKTLLIGGSGTLGSSIISSGLFKDIYYPSKSKLNILDSKKIRKVLKQKKYDLIINCAAKARMRDCENNISSAIDLNVLGVLNLIREIKICYKKNSTRFIHISTDAVYSSIKGKYSEAGPTIPYNVYGWTKLYSESIVKALKNYVIVRTRFFDKKNIKHKTAAIDIFTSAIEIEILVKEIKSISMTKFIGIINVGEKRKSDFENYKKFKPKIKPCKRIDIMKSLNFKIAKDSSMDLSLLKKIRKNYGE